MLNKEIQERIKFNNRIMSGKAFLIKTPATVRLLKELNNWLTSGALGAIVYGEPRLGKTSATRWTLKAIPELYGPVPIVEIPVREEGNISEGGFFEYLLKSVKHREATGRGSKTAKRNRFTEWLCTKAQRSSINTVIIFFDEAQNLKEIHYDWLVNILNEVEMQGYRVFFLLVGQPELLTVRSKFEEEGREQITGRFMAGDLKFSGITSEKDLLHALDEFDATIYPVATDTPFASNFIPIATRNGFKLSSMAPAFWGIFEKKWMTAGLGPRLEIPMHYFTSALLKTLTDLTEIDQESLNVSHSIIAEGIALSGFDGALRSKLAARTR